MDRFRHFATKQDKSWFEDALSGLAQAQTKQSIGEAYYSIASAVGFRNLVLVEMRDGKILDVTWTRLPPGFADVYIARSWADYDPILHRATQSRTPICWQDVLDSAALTAPQRAMMQGAAALGVHSGYTIPFHGPDNNTNLISISRREPHINVDTERVQQLIALTQFCHSRLAEFEQNSVAPALAISQTVPKACAGLLSPIERAANTPFTLTHAHLRELVLIEVGVRRWQMGLTELGTKIFKSRSKREIADLEGWGLVVELPDDERWCFHLAPSVLGWSYLRNRTEVEWIRRHIWEHEIDRSEVPDVAGIN